MGISPNSKQTGLLCKQKSIEIFLKKVTFEHGLFMFSDTIRRKVTEIFLMLHCGSSENFMKIESLKKAYIPANIYLFKVNN